MNEFSLEFTQEVRATLLKDAPRYYRARIVALPAFEPNWVATLIFDEEAGDESRFFLEYAEQAQGKGPVAEPVRLRVEVDRVLAEAVQEVWRVMLMKTRHPKEPRIGADGTWYHFSRAEPLSNNDPLAPPGFEAGKIWSPSPRSRAGRLVTIGEALGDLARGTPEVRDDLTRKALDRVESLRASLAKR